MVQSGALLDPFDKMVELALGLVLEISNRLNIVKCKNVPKALLDAGYNFIDHKYNIKSSSLLSSSGLTLTNNEIKGIIKVIRSLENNEISLKGTTRKINSQEGGLINFLDPLIRIILPLIKNAHTPLAKIVLIPLWLKVSETDAAIQNNYRLGMRPSNLAKQNLLIISNEEAKDIMKIVKSIKNLV